MTTRWTSQEEEWTGPVFGYLIVFASIMAGIFLLLYWLLQPVKAKNLGLAAYQAPPATFVEPPPRKMDAPDLKELEPSPLHALAQEYPTPAAIEPPKPEPRRTVRKRPRTEETRETRGDPWGWGNGWGSYGQYDRYRQDDRNRRNQGYRQDYRSWW
jgi:hypothetical protein